MATQGDDRMSRCIEAGHEEPVSWTISVRSSGDVLGTYQMLHSYNPPPTAWSKEDRRLDFNG